MCINCIFCLVGCIVQNPLAAGLRRITSRIATLYLTLLGMCRGYTLYTVREIFIWKATHLNWSFQLCGKLLHFHNVWQRQFALYTCGTVWIYLDCNYYVEHVMFWICSVTGYIVIYYIIFRSITSLYLLCWQGDLKRNEFGFRFEEIQIFFKV